MAKIIIYNTKTEDYTKEKNNFYIGRPSPLSNPYTHHKDKETLAKFIVSTREEAIDSYKNYFNENYGTNKEFTEEFDKIYQCYKNGEDVYLECFCKPLSCHGDYIAKMLQQKLIKEIRNKQ